jgi:hypothetical protein
MERLRYLSIAAAVLSFYAESLNCWTRLTGAERRRQLFIRQQTMTKSESGFPMTLWSMEYCKKFLTLVAGLADHMEHDNEVNLGLICWSISLVSNGLSHMALTHGAVLKET